MSLPFLLLHKLHGGNKNLIFWTLRSHSSLYRNVAISDVEIFSGISACSQLTTKCCQNFSLSPPWVFDNTNCCSSRHENHIWMQPSNKCWVLQTSFQIQLLYTSVCKYQLKLIYALSASRLSVPGFLNTHIISSLNAKFSKNKQDAKLL